MLSYNIRFSNSSSQRWPHIASWLTGNSFKTSLLNWTIAQHSYSYFIFIFVLTLESVLFYKYYIDNKASTLSSPYNSSFDGIFSIMLSPGFSPHGIIVYVLPIKIVLTKVRIIVLISTLENITEVIFVISSKLLNSSFKQLLVKSSYAKQSLWETVN